MDKPAPLTIRGRLSFPRFTMTEAIAGNAKSKFPKKPEDVRPSYSVLIEPSQQEKLTKYLLDEFMPWVEFQDSSNGKSALDAAKRKKLIKIIEAAEWDVDPVMGLIKPIYEKTADLAPECVATVDAKGFKGQGITVKAVVRKIDELVNQTDPPIFPQRGLILPINDTTLEVYPGCRVATTIDLFAFVSAGNPGITATGATVVVLDAKAERFGGGGGDVDEESIFMDMDEED